MRIGTWTLLGAALVFAACAGSPGQEYSDSVVDQSGLSLELTGAASEGATSSLTQSGANSPTAMTAFEAQQVGQELVTAPEFLQDVRSGISSLNAGVKAILDQVQSAVQSGDGTQVSANVREYGPKDLTHVTVRLYVKKFDGTHFGWAVQAKPLGADDSAYLLVFGGGIVHTDSDEVHRGRGFVGIDLDNWATVDSGFDGQGKLLCGFAHTGDSKTLAYVLKGFTPSIASQPPVTAAFVGHRIAPSGESRARIVGYFDLAGAGDTPTAAQELVRVRAHWLPGTGGRAGLLATGGDIPSGQAYWGASCWDVSENEVFKILVKCTDGTISAPGTGSCTVVAQSGNKAACAVALGTDPTTGVDVPALDPNDTTPELGAPAIPPAPPASVSDGTTSAPNP